MISACTYVCVPTYYLPTHLHLHAAVEKEEMWGEAKNLDLFLLLSLSL